MPHPGCEIGGAVVEGAIVAHRGVTLGYRITEGDATLCYLPDHEPALGAPVSGATPGWISGFGLAAGASVLIHDAQYTDDEYAARVGWGHSAISDAVTFAHRAEVQKLILFHHDPTHDDQMLDRLAEHARQAWQRKGHDPATVSLAAEGQSITI